MGRRERTVAENFRCAAERAGVQRIVYLGGIGKVRRGRRHPDQLSVGEPVAFWRVENLDVDRLLVLQAQMRLPGEAWLESSMT